MKKILFISLAVVLALSVSLIGCGDGDGEELPSIYIGSGKLDGDGIPVDFFTDIDVRKGFCYAFDYDTYIADAMQGQGVQRGSPVTDGLYGYDPAAPMYSHCLTLAQTHLEAAWGGDVWEKGFKMTVLYNSGNLPRKIACEILSENLLAINAKFQVSILPIAWPTFLDKIWGTRDMPTFQVGWMPDYPHADNHLVPFMGSEGVFSHYQCYGDATTDAAIMAALLETDYATQMGMYAALQQQYYDDAPGIVLAQPLVRRYFTEHISGFYYNPCESSYAGRLLDMSKSDQGGAILYKNPGIFVFETIGDIASLDPAWVYDTSSGMQVGMIYETLIYWDGNSTETFIPLLATDEGTFNATDNTLRFTIRSGVQFSDTSYNLTPEDVEYTFERAMCQDRPGGPIWMFYQPLLGPAVWHYEDTTFEAIAAAVEVDGQDVVFTLDDAAWELPFRQILCGAWASIVDFEYCQSINDWDGTKLDVPNFLHPATTGTNPLYNQPMGTGPWKLNTWEAGIQVILDENATYWDLSVSVPFTQVMTKVVEEWTSRKLSLKAGNADLVYVPSSRFDEMIPDEPDLQVFKALPSLSIDAFFFNMCIGGPPS